MAVPLLYSSVARDTMQLLDGGILDNIPVDVALKEKADIIIAVDMTSPLRPRDKLNALWEVADQITTIMMQEANRIAREKAHVVIVPSLGSHLSSDFSALDSLMQQGEQAAENSIPQIQALITERTQAKVQSIPQKRFLRPSVSFDISATHQDNLGVMTQRGWITHEELQTWVEEEYASGNYSELLAQVTEQSDSTSIIILGKTNPLVKEVLITGNNVVPGDTIYRLLHPLIGLPLNVPRVEETIEQVIKRYRRDGYSLARVRSLRFDSLSQRGIDLWYRCRGEHKNARMDCASGIALAGQRYFHYLKSFSRIS
jgi:hypothetical protein